MLSKHIVNVASWFTQLIKNNTAHPLRIDEFEVYINPKPTIGDDTNQNDNCAIHQEVFNLMTTYPS